MKKLASRSSKTANSRTTRARMSHEFDEVFHLIESARHRASQAVNLEWIDLYWNLATSCHVR